MSARSDMDAVLEELREAGPLHIDELRARLGIASRSRADVAVRSLRDSREIESLGGSRAKHFRIVGDAREFVASAEFDQAVRRLTPPSWSWKARQRFKAAQ